MVRAQARGVIDWSKVRFFDRTWWRRARWLQEALLEEDEIKLAEAAHAQALSLRAAAASRKFDDRAWEQANDYAQDMWDQLVSVHQPWEKIMRGNREKERAKKLISSWERTYGKLDDPETQAKIKQVASGLMKLAEQNREEPTAPRPVPQKKKFARRR